MQNDDSLREIYSELIVVLSIRHVHTDTSTMPFTIAQVRKWTKDKTAISMHVLYQSQTCEKKFNITIVWVKITNVKNASSTHAFIILNVV